jgi:hypothetical protein
MNTASEDNFKSERVDHLGKYAKKPLSDLEKILEECGNDLQRFSENTLDYLHDATDGVVDDPREHEDVDALRGGMGESNESNADTVEGLAEGSVASVERIGTPQESAQTPTPVDGPFYVRRGSNVKGPVGPENVSKGIANGKLKPTDEISSSNSGPWQPLDQSRFSSSFE